MKLSVAHIVVLFSSLALVSAVPTDDFTYAPDIDESDINGVSENMALPKRALGINCRGSRMCDTCKSNSKDVLKLINTIPDDAEYGNGEKIACAPCSYWEFVRLDTDPGLCVFANNMKKKDEKVKGKRVKEMVAKLVSRGCKNCGSNPVHPGNNIGTGQVTMNFVQKSCGPGVCRELEKDGPQKPRQCKDLKCVLS
ncbi:hypothetical protein NX059_004101 [Plenodomus lindquistii]|nr:hypothetical protein NX059_004101 [Plenodomus lindquistii]